jgi:hypothetical protein
MNKTLLFSTVISAMLMTMTACNKDEAPEEPKVLYDLIGLSVEAGTFHLSDTLVKRGQSLTVGFADTTWRGTWTVEPSGTTKILPGNYSAEILFTQPGTYFVQAIASSNGAVSSGAVTVIDEPYTQPVFFPPSELAADDIITLEPLAFKNDVLVFYARGARSYSCWPLLVYHNNTTSTAVGIDFLGTPNAAVINCMPGPYPAPHSFVYTRGYTNGTHPVTIRVGQPLTSYTGTVTIADDKYTFSWPDNIPVVIAPKEISRIK